MFVAAESSVMVIVAIVIILITQSWVIGVATGPTVITLPTSARSPQSYQLVPDHTQS